MYVQGHVDLDRLLANPSTPLIGAGQRLVSQSLIAAKSTLHGQTVSSSLRCHWLPATSPTNSWPHRWRPVRGTYQGLPNNRALCVPMAGPYDGVWGQPPLYPRVQGVENGPVPPEQCSRNKSHLKFWNPGANDDFERDTELPAYAGSGYRTSPLASASFPSCDIYDSPLLPFRDAPVSHARGRCDGGR